MFKNTLDSQHELFSELRTNPPIWWENLKKDCDVYVDIRKDNSLNVYYMGASVMNLTFKRGYCAEIHFKFVPIQPKGNDYLKLQFQHNSVGINPNDLKIRTDFENFNPAALRAIKKQIELFYSKDGEKALQARIVKKDPCIIDTEFAFGANRARSVRIDLVRLDPHQHKIVFFELKLLSDARLYIDSNEDGKKNIIDQLNDYCEFIQMNGRELGKYYATLFRIKRSLGLISGKLSEIKETDRFEVLEKPVLLVGGCSEEWLANKDHIEEIRNRVQQYTSFCYFLGDAPTELNLKISPKLKSRRFPS